MRLMQQTDYLYVSLIQQMAEVFVLFYIVHSLVYYHHERNGTHARVGQHTGGMCAQKDPLPPAPST